MKLFESHRAESNRIEFNNTFINCNSNGFEDDNKKRIDKNILMMKKRRKKIENNNYNYNTLICKLAIKQKINIFFYEDSFIL